MGELALVANGVRAGAGDFATALAEPHAGGEYRTLTAVGAIQLQPQPRTIQAIWLAYNGATVSTSTGSLSAML